MIPVNLAGTFKKDAREFNGLEAIADDLVSEPMTRRVCAVIVETKRIVRDFADGGSSRVVVNVVHIEPLSGDAASDARKYLDEAYRGRTGREAAPETLFDQKD